ncbi:MAG TPA: hypothetical protein VGK90_08965 [Rhizomicrobium sp.]
MDDAIRTKSRLTAVASGTSSAIGNVRRHVDGSCSRKRRFVGAANGEPVEMKIELEKHLATN